MSTTHPIRRAAAAAIAVAAATALTGCTPEETVTTTVDYSCHIDPHHFLLAPFEDALSADYQATAPQAVAPGSSFSIELTPEPFTVDGSSSGGSISAVSDIVWRVAVPAGATLDAHHLEGGVGIGAAPSAAVAGGAVVVTIPGPISAGTPATLPTLTLDLTATAAEGQRIEPVVAGTSTADPGLSLEATITGTLLGTLHPTLDCAPPDPSPALHSVLVSSDTQAPTITIDSPLDGAEVPQGSALVASYSCDDGGGVGVATCVGPVPNGAVLDTSSPGERTFTVTATDLQGIHRSRTATYTIVPT